MIGHDAKRWPRARLAGLAAVALSGVASLGAQPVSAAECSIPQRNRAAILAGVERAMHGHILAEAVLIGTYQKST